LSTASIAVPEAFRYILGALATTGDLRKEAVLDWARMLAYVTGTVDQELLARNKYLATENRILKDQLKGRLMLSDDERAQLDEIGHHLGRKVLAEVQSRVCDFRSDRWQCSATERPASRAERKRTTPFG
jgi:hypothetical protein